MNQTLALSGRSASWVGNPRAC